MKARLRWSIVILVVGCSGVNLLASVQWYMNHNNGEWSVAYLDAGYLAMFTREIVILMIALVVWLLIPLIRIEAQK